MVMSNHCAPFPFFLPLPSPPPPLLSSLLWWQVLLSVTCPSPLPSLVQCQQPISSRPCSRPRAQSCRSRDWPWNNSGYTTTTPSPRTSITGTVSPVVQYRLDVFCTSGTSDYFHFTLLIYRGFASKNKNHHLSHRKWIIDKINDLKDYPPAISDS